MLISRGRTLRQEPICQISRRAGPAPSSGAFAGLLDRPYLILILTVAFWGGNVVAGKAAVGHIDPYALIMLRWAGAFIARPAVRARSRSARDWPVVSRQWWLYLFYGAVGFTTFNVLVYVAAYYTSGINIALDQVAINIFVMIGNFVFFRTRVRPLQLRRRRHHHRRGRGDRNAWRPRAGCWRSTSTSATLLVLLACLAYATYSLALRWRPATHWLSFLSRASPARSSAALVFQTRLRRRLRRLLCSAFPASRRSAG